MGAGFGRIWAGTGGAAAGSSSTAGPASAAAESKPRRRHFIPGGHASRYPFNKIADVMGANDNNCEDFYDLEAKKLDGTTVRSFKYVKKLPSLEIWNYLQSLLRISMHFLIFIFLLF